MDALVKGTSISVPNSEKAKALQAALAFSLLGTEMLVPLTSASMWKTP